MNWHWASCSIAILALAATSASPAPRPGNPCKQMRHSLDRQIDDLKVQQKDELQQCEMSNGGSSAECLLLKEQQKQVLREMRDNRTLQMRNCSGGWSSVGPAVPIVTDLNPSCVNNYASEYPEYPDNDEYHHKIGDPHHRHHYPHYPSTETAAKTKTGSGSRVTPVSEYADGKNSHSRALAGDSRISSSVPSASHGQYGGRTSGESHSGFSHASGGSASYSGGASLGSSHSSGGGSGFSGGSSSSHTSATSSAPASAPSSSSSNSSGGHH
jgi:hypothetical protein